MDQPMTPRWGSDPNDIDPTYPPSDPDDCPDAWHIGAEYGAEQRCPTCGWCEDCGAICDCDEVEI